MNEIVSTQNRIQAHRETVCTFMGVLADQIRHRGDMHDRSKLQPDEFESQVRINIAGLEHEYGSPELTEVIRMEEAGLSLHYLRNSHHPEHHASPRDMGFLDIIEMVIDWHSAALTYGRQDFRKSLPSMREKYDFSDHQWWLIEQVVSWFRLPEIE